MPPWRTRLPATRGSHPLVDQTLDVVALPDALAAVHGALGHFWQTVAGSVPALPDEAWRLRFATAVLEIAANIVRHAFPAGRDPGPMRLRLRWYPDRAVALFADSGVACPVSLRRVRPPAGDLLSIEGGLGLTVARAALDRLEYRRVRGTLNRWRLVKAFPPAQVPA
jgi:anti-sigma regulatory factor (Ser/Thr protein kinase)